MATRGRSASLHDMHAATKALQDLNKKVARIRKAIAQLGTPRDTYAFRDKQIKLIAAAESESAVIETGLSALRSQPDVNTKHLQIMERSSQTVAAELKKAVVEFKTTSRRYDPSGPPLTASASAGGSSDFGNGADQRGGRQAQVQQSGDVVLEMKDFGEVDMAILEERNQDAHAILVESKQLNETMQDLAGLVQEQSEQIQAIDGHVTTTAERVDRGNTHLEDATVLQKAARKKQCCILGIVVVILIAICIPVILSQSNSS